MALSCKQLAQQVRPTSALLPSSACNCNAEPLPTSSHNLSGGEHRAAVKRARVRLRGRQHVRR